jgi:hypothetical protein
MNEIQNTEIKQGGLKMFLTSWRFWRPALAILIGSTAGFLYYRFVGCNSGQCAITSSPYLSTLWGGLLGFFVVSSPCSRNKC